MPKHATTGRNLDNVMLREISQVKKGSFSRAPLIRDWHTERKNGSFRDRRVGKKQGDVIQFQRGMKKNFYRWTVSNDRCKGTWYIGFYF